MNWKYNFRGIEHQIISRYTIDALEASESLFRLSGQGIDLRYRFLSKLTRTPQTEALLHRLLLLSNIWETFTKESEQPDRQFAFFLVPRPT